MNTIQNIQTFTMDTKLKTSYLRPHRTKYTTLVPWTPNLAIKQTHPLSPMNTTNGMETRNLAIEQTTSSQHHEYH